MLANLRTKFLLSLLFGVAVVAALSLYGDLGKIAAALTQFGWGYLPAILGLTLVNYLLRFVKWEFFLGQIGVRDLSRLDSFLIFFAGLSMVITPGKVGEWLKSYLLLQMVGTPFGRSAPIVVAERLSDGVAMALLASGGLVLFRIGWQVVTLVLALAGAILALTWYRPLSHRLLAWAERLPLVSQQAHHLRAFFDSSYTLFSPRNLVIAVTLGFVSWGCECFAFYLVLRGLGVAGGGLLAVQAASILAASTLGGSLFLTPGGLGIAESGITGLLQLLLGLSRELAVTAALLIRLSTLWFGVTLGVVTLLVLSRKLSSEGLSVLPSESAKPAVTQEQ